MDSFKKKRIEEGRAIAGNDTEAIREYFQKLLSPLRGIMTEEAIESYVEGFMDKYRGKEIIYKGDVNQDVTNWLTWLLVGEIAKLKGAFGMS